MGIRLLFAGPKRIKFEEYDEPELKPNEIRIKTLFSGISHGTEMTLYRGINPNFDFRWDRDLQLYKTGKGRKYPIEPGGESVGEVVEVGKDVKRIKTGDIIAAMEHHGWGHRTSHILSEDIAKDQKMPSQLDPILGVFYLLGATALNGVLDSQVNIGETVGVFGMGTMGQIATQLLKISGANVIAIDQLNNRLNLVKELGADIIINALKENVGEQIKEITNGRGADICIETSGSYEALQEAIRSCAYSSKVIAISFYQGLANNLHLGKEFHRNRINILCSQIREVNPCLRHRWNYNRLVATVTNLLLKKKLKLNKLITHKIKFKEAQKAFNLIDEHPEKIVQVVLDEAS